MSAPVALDALRVDTRDRRPLYVQIADEIAGRIDRGELAEGERLPGVRDIAARLGVGVVTASQAYDSLVARGRAVARSGRGTFVSTQAIPRRAATPSDAAAGSTIGVTGRRWEPDIGGSRARMETIGERLARGARPGTISLATGHPAPQTFPLAEFGRCVSRTLSDDPPEAMQYASGSGDPDLRETLARTLRSRGVAADPGDIVICSGAQQAADLVANVVLESRAVVAAESPSYAPTLGIFDARGVSYVELVADRGGLRLDDVERAFAEYRPRLLYVNPFAQNPTGAVLGDRRARAIVELARRYDVVILEDQTGWVFTYEGAAPAPLAAHDTDGRVILIESLSKSVFPALRVGYVYLRARMREALEAAKTRTDSFTSTLTQRALWRFLVSPAYPKHLRAARTLYRHRRDDFVDEVATALPWARVEPPGAGTTLWLPLPERITSDAAFDACASEGVLVMPAGPWYPTRSGPPGLRLGFGDLDAATAREAVVRLQRALTALAGL